MRPIVFLVLTAVALLLPLASYAVFSRNVADLLMYLEVIIFALIAVGFVDQTIAKRPILKSIVAAFVAGILASAFWFYWIFVRLDLFHLMHPLDVGLLIGIYAITVFAPSIIVSIAFSIFTALRK